MSVLAPIWDLFDTTALIIWLTIILIIIANERNKVFALSKPKE